MALEAESSEPSTPDISHIASAQSYDEEKQTIASTDELKSSSVNADRNIGKLTRNLKFRHIQFLALSRAMAQASSLAVARYSPLPAHFQHFWQTRLLASTCSASCIRKTHVVGCTDLWCGACPRCTIWGRRVGSRARMELLVSAPICVPIEFVVAAIVIKYWDGARAILDAALVSFLFVAMIVTNMFLVPQYGVRKFVLEQSSSPQFSA